MPLGLTPPRRWGHRLAPISSCTIALYPFSNLSPRLQNVRRTANQIHPRRSPLLPAEYMVAMPPLIVVALLPRLDHFALQVSFHESLRGHANGNVSRADYPFPIEFRRPVAVELSRLPMPLKSPGHRKII